MKKEEKITGKEHPDYALILFNMAFILSKQDLFEDAIDVFEQARQILEKTIGKQTSLYLHAYEKYFQEALIIFEECLSILENMIGTEHYDYITTLQNIEWLREHL
jgi:tetratricopeptide (TPR) repeat protein